MKIVDGMNSYTTDEIIMKYHSNGSNSFSKWTVNVIYNYVGSMLIELFKKMPKPFSMLCNVARGVQLSHKKKELDGKGTRCRFLNW